MYSFLSCDIYCFAMKNTVKGKLGIGLFLLFIFMNSKMSLSQEPGNPNWGKYHNKAETHAILTSWAKAFPKLTNLYSIGTTLKGTPLMVLEITNKETGNVLEKPAYYYDGNIHSGELASAEVILYFAWYVLNNYDRNPRIKRLLDTRTLYVRPKFNPDGADIAMGLLHNLRSTPRPYDEDKDGLLDEDPPNDLNNDGQITAMRFRNPNGLYKISPDDERIMIQRGKNERNGEFYNIFTEGIDDDGDGNFNEDDIGGIDMNRNFPRNWTLEFKQRGAGPYPLSEPETRATVRFFHTHRNITGVFHGHTSGGFLFRPPSTVSWDNFNPTDQDLILDLADQYQKTTNQPVLPSFTDPRISRHGTLISWAYWDCGIVGFVPEFWGGFGRDYDNSGEIMESERLRWNDEELNGEGFLDWVPYDHPQLGLVEIGGWKYRYTRQNPPPHLLKGVLDLNIPWMLWLAEISPRLVIKKISTAPAGPENTIKITVEVENEGYLSTNITKRAVDAEIAIPVRAAVELSDATLVKSEKRMTLGHLKGLRDNQDGKGKSGESRVLTYEVLITGPQPVFSITIQSEKGGVVRREIHLE